MIVCPFCKAELETEPGEILEWCDICGEELLYCPTCREPKKGSACPRCGDMLVKASELSAAPQASQPAQPQQPQMPRFTQPQQPQQPQIQNNPLGNGGNMQNIMDNVFSNFNFGGGSGPAPQQGGAPKGGTMAGPAIRKTSVRPRLALVYQGNNIDVVEGVFGRNGGAYPFMTNCPYISGRHGEIKWFENHKAWGIVDHGSTNGTFINGVQLNSGKWYLLEPGCNLGIADLEFQVIKL